MARNFARTAESYRIAPGKKLRIAACDPGETGDLTKERATAMLAARVEKLSDLQLRLYANDSWSLLLVFQAMDAAGKDGTVRHVLSGINPQGIQVTSYKAPSAEELDHDFLWRHAVDLPERGRIGIFNRSHYEEVLVVRVHSKILAGQRLPKTLVGRDIWKQRYESINDFERHLARNGTRIVKFFLNVSKEEQRKRFLERLDVPKKHWKFAMGDVLQREFWNDYMRAYEEAIAATSTAWAPWYVVPADHKWFTREVVQQIVIAELEKLGLKYPKMGPERKKEIAEARRFLEREKTGS